MTNPSTHHPQRDKQTPPFEKGGQGGFAVQAGFTLPAQIPHLDLIATAPQGVKRLRELILELAVRGKLVPQDLNDEPASELLKRIQTEKARLVAEGKIKKDKPLPEIGEDEKPFELPVGWEWIKLGSVIDFVNGYAFSSSDFTTSGIGVVKIGDISGGQISTGTMSRVAPGVVANLDMNLQVHKGEMVIAMSGATTGKLGFNETQEAFYLNQRVGKISPVLISVRFLHTDLATKVSENLRKSAGSAIPNLSTEQIKNIVLGLPPLPEQHRIVAKVDELMALCDRLEAQQADAASAHTTLVKTLLDTLTQSGPGSVSADDFGTNWQRLAQHFDTLFTTEASIAALKQTLLQLAIMGKLVPQNPKDEPASELLKRIQAEKAILVAEGKIKKDKPLREIGEDEKPFELPAGWVWSHLSGVTAIVTDGDHQPPPRANTGVPFLVIGNLNNGHINFEGCRIVPDSYFESLDWSKRPSTGDLLYTVTGSFGITIQVETDLPFCVQRHVAILKCTGSTPVHFLRSVLRSKMAMDYAESVATGIAQKTVPLSGLRRMPLPIPPLPEQHRIVAKVDEFMALCDQLTARLKAARELSATYATAATEAMLEAA
jgi:type I restriction enzyme S subunit